MGAPDPRCVPPVITPRPALTLLSALLGLVITGAAVWILIGAPGAYVRFRVSDPERFLTDLSPAHRGAPGRPGGQGREPSVATLGRPFTG